MTAAAPPADRLARTQATLRDRGISALLVGPSADLRYLTGYHALPLERLTMLVVPADGAPALLVPALEAPRAASSGATDLVDLRSWTETEDPMTHVADLFAASGAPSGGAIAVQDRLWASFLLRLQATFPEASWVEGNKVMRELRLHKTAEEVARLRAAGAAIDEVHRLVPTFLRAGRTETEVGRDIADAIHRSHDEVNFVIVASGPNGASPHHETGDRVIEPGDAVVVDIGGTLDGYCSDCTRNYVVGTPDPTYAELHLVLEEAQKAGVAASVAGATAEGIDAACRDHLEAAGYGQYFVHRTGHGIGVEEHEEPWIVSGNDEVIGVGAAFSIEPGIYVPDTHGARIEDIVVVTDGEAERLNLVDRALRSV